jgi:uncharacterized protein YecT (DUF1311 family)
MIPPVADMPSAKDRKRLQGCSAESLYYGLGTTPNAKDARLCAFIELDEDPGALPFGGAAMLMTIYGNGSGVARNPSMAKHFACMLDNLSPSDLDELAKHIDESTRTGKRIVDICDLREWWGGFIGYVCGAHQEAFEFARLENEERSIVSRWPTPRREAFGLLKKAADIYEQRRKLAEILEPDGERIGTQQYYEKTFRSEFVVMLKAVESPDGLAAKDLKALDRELNVIYRALMKALELVHADNPDTKMQSSSSLREAELAWLQYVDAWEHFRSETYPDLPSDRLRAQLTEQRIVALNAFRKRGNELFGAFERIDLPSDQ